MGWLLDSVPWWAWLVAGGAVLVATIQLWGPAWLALPKAVKWAAAFAVAVGAAYLAGRNKGAAGVLQREQEKDKANAERITDAARRARAAADARNAGDGLRNDDGWRRD